GVEHEAARVVLPLVGRALRAVAADPVRAPLAASHADRLLRPVDQRRAPGRASLEAPACIQVEAVTLGRGRRPDRLGDPATGADGIVTRRRDLLLHESAQHRLAHDPRVFALEPVVPPAEALLEISDGRTRNRLVAVLVPPRADQPEARHREMGQEPGDGVGVAVHPAPRREDRTLYGPVRRIARTVLPVAIAPLVPEPHGQREGEEIEALLPLPAPVGARDLRVRWPREA